MDDDTDNHHVMLSEALGAQILNMKSRVTANDLTLPQVAEAQ